MRQATEEGFPPGVRLSLQIHPGRSMGVEPRGADGSEGLGAGSNAQDMQPMLGGKRKGRASNRLLGRSQSIDSANHSETGPEVGGGERLSLPPEPVREAAKR
eukprot:15061712-Alexandrium_andersonii.AAC.1